MERNQIRHDHVQSECIFNPDAEYYGIRCKFRDIVTRRLLVFRKPADFQFNKTKTKTETKLKSKSI